MRKYTDRRGGLEIEKKESQVESERALKKARMVPINVEPAAVIDTAISYQVPTVGSNSTENGGNTCVVCGIQTAYDNRHFCVECWKKYKDDLVDKLKESLDDVEIEIS